MLGDIKEHMDVIASDGNRIGRVDHVDDHVHLNLTEDQAKDMWTDKQ